MNSIIEKDMEIEIDGMGLVLYSSESMKYVSDGENFFQKEFSTPQKVAEHIAKGDIVGFNTGTGGRFNIKIREGYPNNTLNEQFPISIRLAIEAKGKKYQLLIFIGLWIGVMIFQRNSKFVWKKEYII